MPQVIHRDLAVLVEVESHPVVLDEDLHVGVGVLYVSDELLLALTEHIDQHADEISCVIVEDDDFLVEFFNGLLELDTLITHGFILREVVDVRISRLVGLTCLKVLETLAAFIEP